MPKRSVGKKVIRILFETAAAMQSITLSREAGSPLRKVEAISLIESMVGLKDMFIFFTFAAIRKKRASIRAADAVLIK